MSSWIGWIVLGDLPIPIVQNEQYPKYTTLKPMTYKTVSKKVEDWLRLEKQIDRTVPLVGCALHRLKYRQTTFQQVWNQHEASQTPSNGPQDPRNAYYAQIQEGIVGCT